jgi:phosphoglucosamine mutase
MPARGRANRELSPLVAYRFGRAAATRCRPTGGRLVVAQDRRRSGDMLVAAVVAGATSMGTDVVRLGIAPAGAVAFVAARWRYDGGILVSGCDGPAEENGLRFLGADGRPLDEAEEHALLAVAEEADSLVGPGDHDLGVELPGQEELRRYREDRLALAAARRAGVRVVVHCGHGAASGYAGELIAATGAEVRLLGTAPAGAGLAGWGLSARQELSDAVQEQRADVGIALDGDADRFEVVDELGRPVEQARIHRLLATHPPAHPAPGDGRPGLDALVTALDVVGLLGRTRCRLSELAATAPADDGALPRGATAVRRP